ncbi:hypothetical protein ACJMK2_025022 [Sinanodonta woodiana]|uniref:PiggyBac transposable element-derived protein domain-containing protein n=1 Tax=Sinanodonta woodiana TaxID=1069815 RepID=A0ABD3XJ30_SINWO
MESHNTLSVQRPYNVYIMINTSSCEAVAVTNEEYDKHNRTLFCPVFDKSQPSLATMRMAYKQKTISKWWLDMKAIMVTNKQGSKIFLTIWHEF